MSYIRKILGRVDGGHINRSCLINENNVSTRYCYANISKVLSMIACFESYNESNAVSISLHLEKILTKKIIVCYEHKLK